MAHTSTAKLWKQKTFSWVLIYFFWKSNNEQIGFSMRRYVTGTPHMFTNNYVPDSLVAKITWNIPLLVVFFVGGDTTWLNWDCYQFHQEYVLLFTNQSSNQYFHGMGQVFCHSSILLGTRYRCHRTWLFGKSTSPPRPPRKVIPRTKHWGFMGMG